MIETRKGGTQGRGRWYLGLGISGIALLWLAKKAAWLGVGSSGVFWPVLLLGVGLAVAAGGVFHTGRRRCARGPGVRAGNA